jgi:histidine triad (HIT) family protein
MNHDDNCLFCRIVQGKIPARKVYEDDLLLAFHDINPWAPVHFLIIPKEHIASMAQLEPRHAGLMGHLMGMIPRLALQEGCRPAGRRSITCTFTSWGGRAPGPGAERALRRRTSGRQGMDRGSRIRGFNRSGLWVPFPSGTGSSCY